MRYLLLILLPCLYFSCTDKDDLPKGVLKPEKMEAVFWDYIRADTYTIQFLKKDSTLNLKIENLKLQDKLFKTHNVTREEFYKSYTWYSNHKELMTRIVDSMIVKKQRVDSAVVKPIIKPEKAL